MAKNDLNNAQRAKKDETFQYENGVQHNKDGSTSSGNKVNDGPTILFQTPPNKFPYYTCSNREGFLQVQYARILIKRRKTNEN